VIESEFSLEQQLREVHMAVRKNNISRIVTVPADEDTAAAGSHEDKNALPVMHDAASTKPRKQAITETNISVLWHELISPLTVIKGYATTLLQFSDDITEEQKVQYLKGIDSASNRVIRLLENLRDITSLEETHAVAPQRIYVSELLRQTAAEMQNQTTKHIIKLRPSARLPLAKADPEKIEMVINNLLVNAIKYSPDGGSIEVEIREVRTEQDLKAIYEEAPRIKLPSLVTSVTDNGAGIPEAELNQIFKKFYRVKNKLTNSTQGAGLGLYICKIIIEAHGGHIWASNRLQGGSIFYFSLPLD